MGSFPLKKFNLFFIILFSIHAEQVPADTVSNRKLVSALFEDIKEPDKVIALLKMHIKAGANVNSKDVLGTPILLQAVNQGHGEAVLNFLIDKGADVNARGDSGLTIAHKAAHDVAMLKFFESRGANLKAQFNTQDNGGYTPFHSAINNYDVDMSKSVIRFLLARGANPNIQNKDGDTPLHLSAIAASRRDDVSATKILANTENIDLSKKNNRGETFFDLLIKGGKFRAFCKSFFHAISLEKAPGLCQYSESGKRDRIICKNMGGRLLRLDNSFFHKLIDFFKNMANTSILMNKKILKNKCGYEDNLYCEAIVPGSLHCSDGLNSSGHSYVREESKSIFSKSRNGDLKMVDPEEADPQKSGVLN